MRAQLEHYRWYRQIFDGYQEQVDQLLERAPVIPLRKGRAFFESCPDDSAVLTFDPYAPERHVCPSCGKDWTGEKFDGGWVRQFQEWLAKRLIEAGLVYRVSGNEAYAAYVRQCLSHFTSHYRDYPLESNLLGPTRLFQSTYLESFWLTDLVTAYDLVRSAACFSAEDHKAIHDLFYASAQVIRSFDEKRSNRQAFNNVALGAVGLLYEDAELVAYALEGPHGFAFHMRESLLEDGLWYEGENYHFATLHHLLDLAEMARQRGIDLYHGRSGYGSLEAMFYGPLKVMYPDLTFPARKDGWFGRGIAYYQEIYELGYARYRDERLGGLLAAAYRGGERQALSPRGFLSLDPELPRCRAESLRPEASEEMPGTGVGVLRSDGGTTYASLEYGHYGGGHGHPDRLHLSFYAEGQAWLTDPGTGWYHVPELGWYRATLAHNTVSVDGLSQRPSEGQLTAFGSVDGFKVAQARIEDAYPGVAMRRTICLGEGYLFDAFDLQSDEEHCFDWVVHSGAHWEMTLEPEVGETAPRKLAEGNGYEFLSDLRRLRGDRLEAELRADGRSLCVLQLGASELYRATAPGIPLREVPFHTLIARRRARTTRYVTCYLFGENASDARLDEEDPGLYTLRLTGETHRIALDDAPGLAVSVERRGQPEAFAWFGKREVALPGLSMRAERSLSQALLRRDGSSWRASLPESFGVLRLSGLAGTAAGCEVVGLPDGATCTNSKGVVSLRQAPGVRVWLDGEDGTWELFSGCSNQLRFLAAVYGDPSDRAAPALELPAGWELLGLDACPSEGATLWEATLKLPAQPGPSHGVLWLDFAGERHSLPYRVSAPLHSRWSVQSLDGHPHITLHLDERRGASGNATGRVAAPWLLDSPHAFAVDLAPYASAAVHLPLPMTPLAQSAEAWGQDGRAGAELWPLPGTDDNSGLYTLQATVRLEDFSGSSRARFPLYWAPFEGEGAVPPMTLDRPEQAYWAETPWQNEADASARASVSWSARGLHLRCEVRDDLHVHDANQDDLYENDSLQVYLDARAKHHQDHHFTPGVAAYTLAPDGDKRTLQIAAIAGNREISNRGARAGWLRSEGIAAEVTPTAGGYRLEAFFPYADLGIAPLRAGDVLGFDLALSDNDGTWYRKLQLMWSGARGRRCYIRGSYHDPREYGYLIVVPKQAGGAS